MAAALSSKSACQAFTAARSAGRVQRSAAKIVARAAKELTPGQECEFPNKPARPERLHSAHVMHVIATHLPMRGRLARHGEFPLAGLAGLVLAPAG